MKKSKILSLLSISVLALSLLPAMAQNQAPKDVVERIQKVSPVFLEDGFKIDEILTTPIPNIFEIRIGKGIVYIDGSANYFFTGEISDLVQKKNLTKIRMEDINKIDFSKIPLNLAIKFKSGNGSQKIAVFADPNCGYCKILEKTLQQIDNVTVYVMPYPILSNDSIYKTQNIWCSKDPSKAWLEWMLNGKDPTAGVNYAKCDNTSVAKGLAYGRSLGITSTPTIVFEDGKLFSGALSKDGLEKKIKEAANSKMKK